MDAGAVSVRLHSKGPEGAKPKGEVVKEILRRLRKGGLKHRKRNAGLWSSRAALSSQRIWEHPSAPFSSWLHHRSCSSAPAPHHLPRAPIASFSSFRTK